MSEDYWWCSWLHRNFMRWVFGFAMLSTLLNVTLWMFTTVEVLG